MTVGPVSRWETTSTCVHSPGNWRPCHICSSSWGLEEITKTFQPGPEQGDKGEALSRWWPGVIRTPRSSAIPFHPLRSPTLSLFIILWASRIRFTWVNQKAYQIKAEAGIRKPLASQKLSWTSWQCGWNHRTQLIAFSTLELFFSPFPLILVWNLYRTLGTSHQNEPFKG